MFRNIAAVLVSVCWALWLGGLVALFLFVTRLFSFDRNLAIQTAPQLFAVFERYQIVLAALGLVSIMGLRVSGKSVQIAALFWLFAIATLPAALGPIFISRRMQALVADGQTGTPEFKKLHGESMLLYSGETLVLLAAGTVLPWATAPRKREPAN
jgi:hypothetical protein